MGTKLENATKQADFVATIWISGIPTEIHFINVPKTGEEGYALSNASMTSFMSEELRKLLILRQQKENGEFGVLYKRASIERFYEYRFRTDKSKTERRPLYNGSYNHKLREFHHTSLWDFYNAVDYDIANKRWIC